MYILGRYRVVGNDISLRPSLKSKILTVILSVLYYLVSNIHTHFLAAYINAKVNDENQEPLHFSVKKLLRW